MHVVGTGSCQAPFLSVFFSAHLILYRHNILALISFVFLYLNAASVKIMLLSAGTTFVILYMCYISIVNCLKLIRNIQKVIKEKHD